MTKTLSPKATARETFFTCVKAGHVKAANDVLASIDKPLSREELDAWWNVLVRMDELPTGIYAPYLAGIGIPVITVAHIEHEGDMDDAENLEQLLRLTELHDLESLRELAIKGLPEGRDEDDIPSETRVLFDESVDPFGDATVIGTSGYLDLYWKPETSLDLETGQVTKLWAEAAFHGKAPTGDETPGHHIRTWVNAYIVGSRIVNPVVDVDSVTMGERYCLCNV